LKLVVERDALWTALDAATFLSTDEKRALAGFSPLPSSAKFRVDQPRVPSGNPDGGQWTNGDYGQAPVGTPADQAAKRPRPPGIGHNRPPTPIPPIVPPWSGSNEQQRLYDETGALAPRGFSNLDDVNAFKAKLAEELPRDVSAVMQGSSVERGGANFRDARQGSVKESDFDVALQGGDIFSLASSRLPRYAGFDKVGPLNEEQLKEVSSGCPLRHCLHSFRQSLARSKGVHGDRRPDANQHPLDLQRRPA
ncbi:MAG: hypothetical protein JSS20_13795, partial [Proteobacteria bacterium]|nr:hypothetical protein [Pseudomonadota bacterium]